MIKKQKNKIAINHSFPSGILVLDNKLVFKGIGLGYQGTSTGEVCFNTSLTGYQEIISDPSYAGQIINFTFPHIGNVGTNNEDLESDKVWTKGAIFNSEITSPSNYRSLKTLYEWLKKKETVFSPATWRICQRIASNSATVSPGSFKTASSPKTLSCDDCKKAPLFSQLFPTHAYVCPEPVLAK